MVPSLVFWIAVPVLLFWSVGAYNRLVRLRSEAKTAFAAMETELARQVELVQACLPSDDGQPASTFGHEASFWAGLQGAATQFSASLAAARQRPLDPDGLAALGAAQDVLAMAWERVERDDAHDLAGSRLPDTVTARRAHLANQIQAAAGHFNAAVARYNLGIAQFPAVLLAWLFGFKPAQGMRLA
ncbi:MAG: LemA family protein [Burkholderiales bacterium]|nr:MAG: LemA family protein [Burkholderiales bacterium]